MADPSAGVARENAVLASLSDDEYGEIVDGAEFVSATLRQRVYEPDQTITHVYFPVDAVYSVVADIDRRHQAEVCTVGREGMAGLPVFLERSSVPHAAFCQVEGSALRVPAERLQEMVAQSDTLRAQLTRVVQATMVQLAQNVACNRGHLAEPRAARWLLMTHDRVGRNTFSLTQEFLAQMLGVRRATISEIASKFQNEGRIRYQRGVITIADREALEAVACRCYSIIREEFDRLRPPSGED